MQVISVDCVKADRSDYNYHCKGTSTNLSSRKAMAIPGREHATELS